MPIHEYITMTEAARLAGLSTARLSQLVGEHRLQTIRLDGRTRLTTRAWLETALATRALGRMRDSRGRFSTTD